MSVSERVAVLEGQLLKLTELAVAVLDPVERNSLLEEVSRIQEIIDTGELTRPRAYPVKPARPRKRAGR